MHERDLQAEHPPPGLDVDQLRAVPLELPDHDADVLHLEGDVMHAGAPAREELTHGRVVAERSKQLDPAPTDEDRRSIDALLLDMDAVLEPASKQALVRRDGLIEIDHRDAHVMQPASLHPAIVTAQLLRRDHARHADGLGRA